MVQRLEHHRAVKRGVGKRQRLGARGHKLQTRLRAGEVLGVLNRVHLQPGHLALRPAPQQPARQPRIAATDFDDGLGLQRHQLSQHIKLVALDR